ncbi:MAG: hypothetical protein V4773_16330 [Verrucomicrobiota bacterium]
MSDAKKEFDAIKAARDPGQQQKGAAVPRLSMPELQTGSSDPRPLAPAKAGKQQGAAGSRSGNWLVEAMERDARRGDSGEQRGGAGREGGDRRLSSAREREGDATAEESRLLAISGKDEVDVAVELAQARARAEEARAEQHAGEKERSANAASAAASNPLTRFLGEWMTPRDYAVLKPGLDEAASGSAGGANSGALPTSSSGLSISSSGGLMLPGGIEALMPGGGGFPGSGSAGGSIGGGGGGARENPYLQGFETTAGGGGGGANVGALPSFTPPVPPLPQASPAGPGPGAFSPVPVPAPVAPAKPQIPDFARPAQDEKYFKQLKRF